MREFKLKRWYPSLPTEWHGEDNIIVVERGYNHTVYELHPSLKGTTRFAILTEREVENNSEFWEEVVYKKSILTTEDGVKLFEGDIYYVPQRTYEGCFSGTILELRVDKNYYSWGYSKRFADKRNAEEYIKTYKNYKTTDGKQIVEGQTFYLYDDK
jgi:hypothetical protein